MIFLPVYGLASTTDTSWTPGLSSLNPVTEYWVSLVNGCVCVPTVTVSLLKSEAVIALSVTVTSLLLLSLYVRLISSTVTACGCTAA